MNKWVLLEHKVFSGNSFDIHYDFLIEDKIDCLTWKLLKLPSSNEASVAIIKQKNHRLVWLLRKEHELSGNRGLVKRIDHGIFKNVSDELKTEGFRYILDGEILFGLLEISDNICRLSENN